MVVFSFWWESLGFFFKEDFGVSSVLLRDSFKVFVLICFYGPFLGKVGLVDDDFVFFSLFGPGKLVVHIIGHLHKIDC